MSKQRTLPEAAQIQAVRAFAATCAVAGLPIEEGFPYVETFKVLEDMPVDVFTAFLVSLCTLVPDEGMETLFRAVQHAKEELK